MIDLHSHALPEFDDGAQSVEMSLEMLQKSYEQGVRTVVLTPHFRAVSETELSEALARRQRSYETLCHAAEVFEKPLPKLLLGSELSLNADMLSPEKIRPLCIENTDYLLVEMPYKPWTRQHLDSLDRLSLHYRIVLAHIERFWDQRQHFPSLSEYDVLFQVNAVTFCGGAPFSVIQELMKNGMVQVLGSDMHNTESRPPNLSDGIAWLDQHYGTECGKQLQKNAEALLQNRQVERQKFRPKTIYRFFHGK